METHRARGAFFGREILRTRNLAAEFLVLPPQRGGLFPAPPCAAARARLRLELRAAPLELFRARLRRGGRHRDVSEQRAYSRASGRGKGRGVGGGGGGGTFSSSISSSVIVYVAAASRCSSFACAQTRTPPEQALSRAVPTTASVARRGARDAARGAQLRGVSREGN